MKEKNNKNKLKHKYNRMGCFLSKDKDNVSYINSSEDNFIYPKKKKRIRKRKRDKKKKIDKKKQQSIISTLFNKNSTETKPLISKNNGKNISKKKRKAKIPLAMRQNVWIKHFGKTYEHKCYVSWCTRIISCFDFEVGHNIPECKGGKTDESNLFPICHKCNGGMGSRYTIEEWSNKKFFEDYHLKDK